jgi:hypothetical protein
MVEVFITNVNEPGHAAMLLEHIHTAFGDYEANFDLEDRDRILRVECIIAEVQSSAVIELLKRSGFYAEVLPDELVAPGPPAQYNTF